MSDEKVTRISGYLEKRGKLSIMGRWKKWWCVLEGQLLLYYKSRIEYANLSPCCGSLNMAFVKNVQPHVGFQIHIVTHTQIIILRTKNKEKQQQWFYALVGVLPQNSYLAPLLYLATNSIEYRRKSERKKKKNKSKHKVFEESTTKETEHDESSSFTKSDNDFSNSAATNDSNFSVFGNHTTEIENISASQDQEEKILFGASKISTSLECKLQPKQEDGNSEKCSSEVNIRRCSSYHSLINGASATKRIANRRSISCECVFTEYLTNSTEQCNFLSSCSIRSADGSQSNELQTDDAGQARKEKRSSRRKRKNNTKKYNTLSGKSLSFLRKIFKMKRENRNEQNVEIENNCPREVEKEKQDSRPMTPLLDPQINISESAVPELEKINTIQTSMTETTENDVTAEIELEEITPCNDFVEQNTTNTSSNNEKESESSDSDSESSIVAMENTQEDEKLPDLPIKNGNRSSYVYDNFKDINSNYPAKITSRNNTDTKELIIIDNNSASMELDSLLLELTALNNQRDKSHESLEFHNNFIDEDEDPDYDIPRPHTLLMSDAGSIPNVHEKTQLNFPLNNGIPNQKYDSLSIDMAPDSLEMPWLTNDTNCSLNYWSTKKEFDLCLDNDSGSEYDYHDSLNSNKYNT